MSETMKASRRVHLARSKNSDKKRSVIGAEIQTKAKIHKSQLNSNSSLIWWRKNQIVDDLTQWSSQKDLRAVQVEVYCFMKAAWVHVSRDVGGREDQRWRPRLDGDQGLDELWKPNWARTTRTNECRRMSPRLWTSTAVVRRRYRLRPEVCVRAPGQEIFLFSRYLFFSLFSVSKRVLLFVVLISGILSFLIYWLLIIALLLYPLLVLLF